MSSLEMKSLASADVSINSCSSKFHLQAKMLFRVSLSSSPRKGQRPLRLTGGGTQSLTSDCACVCMCLCVYLQHVGDDAKAPHVSVEWHKVVVDDLRSKKFWSAKIHSQFLPGFISEMYINYILYFTWPQQSIKLPIKQKQIPVLTS